MKRIPLALLAILVVATANAEGQATPPAGDETCADGKPYRDVQTRYGVVSYKGVLEVNGKYVRTDQLTTGDGIWFKKLFKLGDEDVLVSTGVYLGNTEEPSSQDFLLVLGPGRAPQVILIPGDSACPMWQQGNALYAGGGKDECGNKLPILKFEHDKFVASDVNKPNCVRKPHALEDQRCRNEFDLAQRLCSRIPEAKCAEDANAENAGWYGPLSEMTWLNSAAREQYFDTQGFNELCLAWCKGKAVPYSEYQKSLCMAR